MKGPSETRVVLGMSSMERLANLRNFLESSPFASRGRRRTRTEMGRRFPLQAAEGAQRLQLLPPFPANDG